MNKISIAIVVGSDSDLPVISSCTKMLDEFEVAYSVDIASAHRTPAHLRKIIGDSTAAGAEVFIAAAGMAAALPGVIASETTLPVIGVPLESKPFMGTDALLSMIQMPPGIPVATVAVGKPGAINAAILAVQILAVKYPALRSKLQSHRAKMAESIAEKATQLREHGISHYPIKQKP
ncbi:MAG: 5-(carboxyamino)imidazole ribonucleotide mutase [Elusimicrobia bacterium RIFOXYA2_FULL_50_26]|nr:MAG: 5-(carboxyamino)imidazole ribonucleotide mutase [Elusimicrobia bacterium RIFOXYA2_FULL_50_26]OGS25282.1 MAG: 5-(carboxyamino)imidazole ribonucleotide mutase [Elusimicrobia bacterium RIFOXYB2_FULL_50_12]